MSGDVPGFFREHARRGWSQRIASRAGTARPAGQGSLARKGSLSGKGSLAGTAGLAGAGAAALLVIAGCAGGGPAARGRWPRSPSSVAT